MKVLLVVAALFTCGVMGVWWDDSGVCSASQPEMVAAFGAADETGTGYFFLDTPEETYPGAQIAVSIKNSAGVDLSGFLIYCETKKGNRIGNFIASDVVALLDCPANLANSTAMQEDIDAKSSPVRIKFDIPEDTEAEACTWNAAVISDCDGASSSACASQWYIVDDVAMSISSELADYYKSSFPDTDGSVDLDYGISTTVGLALGIPGFLITLAASGYHMHLRNQERKRKQEAQNEQKKLIMSKKFSTMYLAQKNADLSTTTYSGIVSEAEEEDEYSEGAVEADVESGYSD